MLQREEFALASGLSVEAADAHLNVVEALMTEKWRAVDAYTPIWLPDLIEVATRWLPITDPARLAAYYRAQLEPEEAVHLEAHNPTPALEEIQLLAALRG